MKKSKVKNIRQWRRRNHNRKKVRSVPGRPRLSIFRSNKHLSCQIIDDFEGKTLASASTKDKSLAGEIKYGGNCDAAKIVGKAIAERAKSAGVTKVAFDRGHFKYHGRVASLADAAREEGLEF